MVYSRLHNNLTDSEFGVRTFYGSSGLGNTVGVEKCILLSLKSRTLTIIIIKVFELVKTLRKLNYPFFDDRRTV